MSEAYHPGAGVTLRVLVPDGDPQVLIVHGMEHGADAWAADAAQLGAIVYDRRGHGGSEAPEPYVGTTVAEQAEDAARLLERLAARPLVVAGDGLGALVALDLARRHTRQVRALALRDPLLLQFLPDGAEWLATVAAGARLPVPADLAALTSWPITRHELRAIAVPAVVVTGPASPSQAQRSADVLAELLPAVTRTGDGDLVAAIRSLLSAPAPRDAYARRDG